MSQGLHLIQLREYLFNIMVCYLVSTTNIRFIAIFLVPLKAMDVSGKIAIKRMQATDVATLHSCEAYNTILCVNRFACGQRKFVGFI
jgi:hypothetical protein